MEQETSVIWRLHTVMSARGIRTSTELHRRLIKEGVEITSHQLARIVAKFPERMNTRLLVALTRVLECGLDDLIWLPERAASTPEFGAKLPDSTPSRKRGPLSDVTKLKQRSTKPTHDPLLGPSVADLPSLRDSSDE
jgi:DNA-binding Xre family transcriptional regulator